MTVDREHRLVYTVALKPLVGCRFQPTGFPDIGPAVFERPLPRGGSETVLLVESAQSMANRLESVGWDAPKERPQGPLDLLPWVEICDKDGVFLTSSRIEAHRLASAFVKDATFLTEGREIEGKQLILERLGLRADQPIKLTQVARALATLDPVCLLHGVFFSDKAWPGQPKVARSLTGFVEAVGVERAESGGVKRDQVRHALSEGEGGTSEGYGTVPFHRTEWAAREIWAYFVIDRDQLRAYGLGPEATELLEVLAQWEIRSVLEQGLRLRTACDLQMVEESATDQDGEELAAVDELRDRLRDLAGKASSVFAGETPLRGTWRSRAERRKRGRTRDSSEGDEEDAEEP
jgi:CRISPR-associated protein Csb1